MLASLDRFAILTELEEGGEVMIDLADVTSISRLPRLKLCGEVSPARTRIIGRSGLHEVVRETPKQIREMVEASREAKEEITVSRPDAPNPC